jgi:chromate reductase
MHPFRIFTLVGGISKNSLNKRFFHSIVDLHPEGFQFETYDISKLPFFSQDLEQDPPDGVIEFKEKIREADGFIFITPEYNRSLPGVLKNAIDWGSRPYGMNLWDKMPAAVIGASPGNIGTFGAQHHLRQILAYLNMHVLAQPEFYFNATAAFDENTVLVNEKTKQLLYKYFSAFHELLDLMHGQADEKQKSSLESQGMVNSPPAH